VAQGGKSRSAGFTANEKGNAILEFGGASTGNWVATGESARRSGSGKQMGGKKRSGEPRAGGVAGPNFLGGGVGGCWAKGGVGGEKIILRCLLLWGSLGGKKEPERCALTIIAKVQPGRELARPSFTERKREDAAATPRGGPNCFFRFRTL